MYDLASPSASDGSSMGCQQWGSTCDSNSRQSASYCVHGDCFANVKAPATPKCICDPGYGGDRCEKAIGWAEFAGTSSFLKYTLKVAPPTTTSDVDLLFLPGRQPNGQLVYAASKDSQRHISTSIENWNANADLNLGDTSSVRLGTATKLQGNWSYVMRLRRDPTRLTLSIDDVDRSVASLDPSSTNFEIDYEDLMLGAELTTSSSRNFAGCIGGFVLNALQMPLVDDQSSTPNSLVSTQSSGLKTGCSMRKTCADLGAGYCSGAFVCRDFWKGPFCTCVEESTTLLGDQGTLIGCGTTLAVSSLGISSQAVILILVSLAVLILLVLFMVVYTRRQTPPFERVRPEEMSHDNMRRYDIEGGGQADNDTYNIAGLRKPVMPPEVNGNGYHTEDAPPVFASRPPAATVDDNLRSMIRELESDPNATAPYDELRVYDDEGDGASQCSLSSLSSAGGDAGELPRQLENWGPRFHNLADMYATQD
jgi:hypothetical protein